MFKKHSVAGPIAAAALALGAAAAQAVPVISASIVPNPTAANTPFPLENFGSGPVNGLVSQTAGTLSTGVGYSFTGTSGIYGGDVGSVTRSPFRTAGGAADSLYYLNARAGTAGGSVILDYTSIGTQTAFNLLWGSVDPSPTSYNELTFSFSGGGGSQVINGADVVAGLVGVVAGTSNLAVSITGLNAFDTITITASNEAFEFVPGKPVGVPEPTSLALLAVGLAGIGAAARRRRDA